MSERDEQDERGNASVRTVEGDKNALTLDVRRLPTFSFGHRSLMWWSTMGLMLIEGTVFAIGVMPYFYLRSLASRWPMAAMPPALRWGTLNTIVLLVSLWPNQLAKRAAERQDRQRARVWLSVCDRLTSSTIVLSV